jgi:hydrogenase expression/formation protein HypC
MPAKIESRTGDDAWVVLGDARMRINLIMTPEAQVGDWVLVHAGFAIQELDEQEAQETWALIDELTRPPTEGEFDDVAIGGSVNGAGRGGGGT